MEKQELKHFENQNIRTFGRRHGKKLSPHKQWLMENLLPKITPKALDSGAILEIGFGNGEHLRELALQNPKNHSHILDFYILHKILIYIN